MKFIKLVGVATLTFAILITNTACEKSLKIKDISNQPVVEEQIVPLQFKDVIIENTINEINENKIQEILKQHNVGDNKFIIFTDKEDTDNFHSGVIIGNKIYDFGIVSMIGNLDELYSLQELGIYEKHLVKIQGAMGANYAPTNYYLIDNNVPQLFLHTEGHTQELDIDKDGVKEIVTSVPGGVATSIEIYEYNNENFSMVDINENLKALSVHLEDNNIINVYFNDQQSNSKKFEYTEKELREIK
ncbi:MAG: hypothetical protein K0Q97_2896 [Bacillota bacterium]|jgi:hypothetical protein|nr:hypothetical protein [Bacillota bacterium]